MEFVTNLMDKFSLYLKYVAAASRKNNSLKIDTHCAVKTTRFSRVQQFSPINQLCRSDHADHNIWK